MTATVTRPALRYHGGKWAIADWIIGFFPEHKAYVEPFGGAASILLKKPRSANEVYNELDEEVTNFFRVLRTPPQAQRLQELARLTPFSRKEFEAAKPKAGDDPVERARKLLVRSYMGFSSENIYRKETEMAFRTVSWDAGEDISKSFAGWPAHVPALAARFIGVNIESKPALDVIRRYDTEETLFYVDPPYVLSTRDKTAKDRKLYPFEMMDKDHADLAEMLHDVKGMVVLSGYRCQLYQDWYGTWHSYDKDTKTNRNSIKSETVWLNRKCSNRLMGNLFFNPNGGTHYENK